MWCYLSNCISINKLVFTRPVICAHFHEQRTGTKSNHCHHFYLGFIKKRCSSLTCYTGCTDKLSTTATQELLTHPYKRVSTQRLCHHKTTAPVVDDMFHVDSDHIDRAFKGHPSSETCPLQVLLLSIMLNVQPGQAPHRPLLTKNNIRDGDGGTGGRGGRAQPVRNLISALLSKSEDLQKRSLSLGSGVEPSSWAPIVGRTFMLCLRRRKKTQGCPCQCRLLLLNYLLEDDQTHITQIGLPCGTNLVNINGTSYF